MTDRDVGAAAQDIAQAFAAYCEAMRAYRMSARSAAFAALCLAATGALMEPGEAAQRTGALSRDLRDRRDIKARGHRAVRDMAAAMLVAAGRGADDLAAAQARLRELPVKRDSQTLIAAGLTIAAADPDAMDAAACERLADIRRAFPGKWWRAPRLSDAAAVALALRGVDGRTAAARMAAAERGLRDAGLRAGQARKAAPAAIAFDPDPRTLSENVRSLLRGRSGEGRLRWFDHSGRATLGAAAPDPDSLHAALAPMLDAAQGLRWTQGRPVRAAVARGLALGALGKADPAAAMADLTAIMAAEAAAATAAAAGAAGAAGATG